MKIEWILMGKNIKLTPNGREVIRYGLWPAEAV